MARFFVNRPIVAIVIAIVMVIVGVVALLGLPISQYPNIVPPEIFINTTYVGADAQTVEQSVATPIEQEMSGVDNMNYMYSLNANNGELKLYVNFDVNTDPNIDQVLTQMRQGQAASQLPSDAVPPVSVPNDAHYAWPVSGVRYPASGIRDPASGSTGDGGQRNPATDP